jgi:hypothetical protein
VRVAAADWSGAARNEQSGLWLAEADTDSRQITALMPLTRQQAGDHLLDLATTNGPGGLLVGLDFGFSLPAWYLDDQGIKTAADLWADTDRLEGWLRDCQPPFWGRPGRRRPDQAHWRRTELAMTPRPRSVFQIGGAGAVGTASLRGMPVLHRLQSHGFAIWPFDPAPDRHGGPIGVVGSTDANAGSAADATVVEVWPRLATGPVVKSSPAARQRWLSDPIRQAAIPAPFSTWCAASADAFDAVAAALALLDSPPLPAVDDPVVRLEGWIWDPSRASGLPSGHADAR